jgi:hypothetical protein
LQRDYSGFALFATPFLTFVGLTAVIFTIGEVAAGAGLAVIKDALALGLLKESELYTWHIRGFTWQRHILLQGVDTT